jgi:hypothetical protein
VCRKEGSSGDRSDGVPGASDGGGAALKHPCPICLDNEDDAGARAVCYSCGQMCCGICKESLGERGVTNCPTCRAVFACPPKEKVRRLRRLLARPPGRHTPIVHFNLGVYYADGTGVVQDDAEAVRWYRLAADQGLANAQYNLGMCYARGREVAQDDVEAVRWYRLAADQGFANAQYSIGRCYALGIGVAQDDAEAVRWTRLAADQGHADAHTALARLGM